VLIGLDEFQPAIPWQVALQQSLPPLSRPRAILQNKTSPYNDFAANGDNLLNFVSQPKGAVHDHSFFQDFNLPDWSSSPDAGLAAIAFYLQSGFALVQTGPV
jgi:hypothetical protein